MAGRKIRSVSELIRMAGHGDFEEECNKALADALESLKEQPNQTGKANISVGIEVRLEKGEVVQLIPSITSKLPKSKNFGALILFLDDNALSTEHPSQTTMFRDVSDRSA